MSTRELKILPTEVVKDFEDLTRDQVLINRICGFVDMIVARKIRREDTLRFFAGVDYSPEESLIDWASKFNIRT